MGRSHTRPSSTRVAHPPPPPAHASQRRMRLTRARVGGARNKHRHRSEGGKVGGGWPEHGGLTYTAIRNSCAAATVDLLLRRSLSPALFLSRVRERVEWYTPFLEDSVVSCSEFGKGPCCGANFRIVFLSVSKCQFLNHPND
jgi:hypothetical protein